MFGSIGREEPREVRELYERIGRRFAEGGAGHGGYLLNQEMTDLRNELAVDGWNCQQCNDVLAKFR